MSLHHVRLNGGGQADGVQRSIVVPGSIDTCVHRLPDGRWGMWFKNEQKKIRGNALDSFIRTNRLFTVEQSVILYTAAKLKDAKLQEAKTRIRQLLP